MDHKTAIASRKRVRSLHESLNFYTKLPAEKRQRITSTVSELRSHENTTSHTARIIRGETLLFAPDTPICYTFHSCDVTLIREALRIIRTEDLSMNLNLKTITFPLPKYIDDDGTAVSWLVSLTICLAWCFHCSSVPDIIIAEPELDIEEPHITINEIELPKLKVDLYAGSTSSQERAELSTTATDLVHLFLDFAQGLPCTELVTEEQAIFALADFLHNRPDKCKSCVLWRAAWKECLTRLYGEVIAKTMAKKRNFQPTCV